jgi:enamine deaminase RidA (YjgF/YER057c/UK114 family)
VVPVRRSFDEMDDLAPGRSLLRREDPARVAARSSRREAPPAADADPLVPPVPPQRRVENEPKPPDGARQALRGDELGLLNGARRALRGDDQEAAIRGRASVAEPGRPDPARPEPARPEPARPEPVLPTDPRPAQDRLAAARPAESRLAGLRPKEGRGAEVEGRPAESRLKGLRSADTRKAEPLPAPEARPVRRALAADPEFVRRVNPFELPDPRGYSHATVARGQMVFVAGQTGVDLDGRVVDGGMVKQFDRAVQNFLTALAAAGGSPEHLASVTVQVTSIDEYKANSRPIGHVWRARLGGGLPALTLIEVRRFWDADAFVQIEGHAVLP